MNGIPVLTDAANRKLRALGHVLAVLFTFGAFLWSLALCLIACNTTMPPAARSLPSAKAHVEAKELEELADELVAQNGGTSVR